MEEERKITSEERLWLINEVMNAEGFHGLLEIIENKINANNSIETKQIVNHSDISQKKENTEKKENEETPIVAPDDQTYNYVESSGMYEKDALHLVAAEFGSNLNGKTLNINTQKEQPFDQVKLVEASNPVQTPEQEIIQNNIVDNQELNIEKPMTKIREHEKNNPWSSARTVVPGEIKLR